jgi:hypothetical protein
MPRPLAQAIAATAARPLRIVAALALLSLAAAAWWLTASHALTRTHANSDTALAPSTMAVADRATVAWTLPTILPEPIPQASKTPATTKAAAHEPDWTAFSLGVTDASAAVATQSAGAASSPAEIAIALSREDRGRLIAAAKEAESAPPPAGYTPGIAWTVPAGSGNDGICR